MAISIDLLDQTINDIFNNYTEEIQEGMKESADKVATESVDRLKHANTYQVRSGRYNRGWRTSNKSGTNFVKVFVHNKTDYQLTHLLEYGHVGKNQYGKWGYVKAFPHITPVEDFAKKEYTKQIEEMIKRGGKQ